jgi:hypothetical protein
LQAAVPRKIHPGHASILELHHYPELDIFAKQSVLLDLSGSKRHINFNADRILQIQSRVMSRSDTTVTSEVDGVSPLGNRFEAEVARLTESGPICIHR